MCTGKPKPVLVIVDVDANGNVKESKSLPESSESHLVQLQEILEEAEPVDGFDSQCEILDVTSSESVVAYGEDEQDLEARTQGAALVEVGRSSSPNGTNTTVEFSQLPLKSFPSTPTSRTGLILGEGDSKRLLNWSLNKLNSAAISKRRRNTCADISQEKKLFSTSSSGQWFSELPKAKTFKTSLKKTPTTSIRNFVECIQAPKVEELNGYFLQFMIENNIPFDAARSKYLRKFMTLVSPAYPFPDPETLETKTLERVYSQVIAEVRTKQV